MIIKYKLSEVAKDLNVPAKGIAQALLEHSGENAKRKNAQSTLTEEELNIIFEHYTQKYRISNIADYLEGRQTTDSEPKPEQKAEQKPEQKREGRPQRNDRSANKDGQRNKGDRDRQDKRRGQNDTRRSQSDKDKGEKNAPQQRKPAQANNSPAQKPQTPNCAGITKRGKAER